MKTKLKVVLVIIAAAAVTVFLAIYIPKSLQVNEKDTYDPQKKVFADNNNPHEADINNDESNTSVGQDNTNHPENADNKQKPDGQTDLSHTATVSPESSQQTDGSSKNADHEVNINDENQPKGHESTKKDTQDQTGTKQNNNESKPIKRYSKEWAEKKIEEHKDEIDPNDLKSFRYIIGKLGEYEIASKFEGGLSEEEQSEIYSHMKATLTEEEFETARQLFIRYNWILYEE